ncbi:hypothetical protein [Candidatus Rhodoluna planktonica]|uniref:Uncharacterized protein n=1 Tax=Candidatus Rhodoluna planktonica TaxID=535712 RepID=A0A1D9DYM5_9MICO|nr:hypothetical protein [Candidatus Rhodoluna planktonica]AOY55901.1 hypothetical protein A4Z71_02625 [Candidatus Rhodoluna planktonica]
MSKFANNSMAMLATISIVVLIASIIGFFNPGNCPVSTEVGWTSCQAIAEERRIASWALLLLSVVGFAVSFVRRRSRR